MDGEQRMRLAARSTSAGMDHTDALRGQGINDFSWEYRGKYGCTASDDKTLKLWDISTGTCLRTLSGHSNFVFSCCFSPANNVLVSGSFDETVRLWDYREGRCLKVAPFFAGTLPLPSECLISPERNRV